MALNSPGVEVQVIDESFYVPASQGTRPMIFVASQENKANGSNTGIAVGTLKANAGKAYLVTSQRDLANLVGNPLFYKDSNGNPVHGGELNEYGLQAAYSYLGVSNSAFVVRADLDLGQLKPRTISPSSNPADGAYWLDTQNTRFGVFEWNGSAPTVVGGQKFTNKIPVVITDATKIDQLTGAPLGSVGAIGTYAVVAITNLNKLYYKNIMGDWVLVGSTDWYMSIATVAGSKSNPLLSNGDSIFINGSEVILQGTSVANLAQNINDASIPGVSAEVVNSRLNIYVDGSIDSITIAAGQGQLVQSTASESDVGIAAGEYYGPKLSIAPHTQVPRYKVRDEEPRPSGSLWIKTTDVALGSRWRVKQWNEAISDWVNVNAPVYANNASAIYHLDNSGGGKNIAKGTLYVKYNVSEYDALDINKLKNADFKIYRRELPDPTTVLTVPLAADTFDNGTKYGFTIAETVPASDTLHPDIAISFEAHGALSDIDDLAAAINAAGFKHVVARVDSRKRVVIEHTLGGDMHFGLNSTLGVASAAITVAGSYTVRPTFTFTSPTNGVTATGTINSEAFTGDVTTAGTGYHVGDLLTLTAADGGTATAYVETLVGLPGSGIATVNFTGTGADRGTFHQLPGTKFATGANAPNTVASTGTGTGAEITVTFRAKTGTAGVTITDSGSGYTEAPTIAGYTNRGGITVGTVTTTSVNVDNGIFDLMGFVPFNVDTNSGTANLYDAAPGDEAHMFIGTNWKPLKYTAAGDPPNAIPLDGTLWFSPILDEVDIMIHNGMKWVGYLDSSSPYYDMDPEFQTDPNGPLVSATKPTVQSDGTTLRNGDIWINSGNAEEYPNMYKWDGYNLKWISIDVADQITEDGVIFADARYNTAGANSDMAGDITELLVSNFVDFDAPDPDLYPRGMLLFNTRRSGNNVKRFVRNYIDPDLDNIRMQGESMDMYYPHRWVNESGNAADGRGLFGRKAQRKVVVKHLKAAIDANQTLRDVDVYNFNLIATPGYCETIQNMVAFNVDRHQTGFVVGDTPFRLPSDTTSILEWGNNTMVAADNGEEALVTYDEYLGVYYPSGFTQDNFGHDIVVPASHMVLRTIALSDGVSYPWFAPAGTRRGGISNASSAGYINMEDGEFIPVALNEGQRDTLYSVSMNPITFLTGSGLVVFGQKTRARNASALDRVNVARLVCYLRGQFSKLAKPYIFEPNDKITRDEIKNQADSMLLELVSQRALYDYLVVCDESNNTPSRIDRNELYLDVAIEPVKAIEFIYIPLRLKNTGEIKGLNKK